MGGRRRCSRCLRSCPRCLRSCPCGSCCLRCCPCLQLRLCSRCLPLRLSLGKTNPTNAPTLKRATRLHSEKKSDGTRCATSDGNKDFIDNFSLHIGLCNQVSL